MFPELKWQGIVGGAIGQLKCSKDSQEWESSRTSKGCVQIHFYAVRPSSCIMLIIATRWWTLRKPAQARRGSEMLAVETHKLTCVHREGWRSCTGIVIATLGFSRQARVLTTSDPAGRAAVKTQAAGATAKAPVRRERVLVVPMKLPTNSNAGSFCKVSEIQPKRG